MASPTVLQDIPVNIPFFNETGVHLRICPILPASRKTLLSALYPQERKLIGQAVTSRIAEFTTGRLITRELLSALGIKAFPLLYKQRQDSHQREPLWPTATTGSISHSDQLCAVVVAHSSRFPNIGVDIEEAEPLEPDLWPLIATRDEHLQVRGMYSEGDNSMGTWMRLIFSIKESVYKAQYPLTGRLLDFQDVNIQLFPEEKRFTATITPQEIPVQPALTTHAGGWDLLEWESLGSESFKRHLVSWAHTAEPVDARPRKPTGSEHRH